MPEGKKLGFVAPARDNVQVMYQTRANLQKDLAVLAKGSFKSSTVLYIEVANLDEVVEKLKGFEVVVPVRKTFYGARESAVREPAGNVATFAAFEKKE